MKQVLTANDLREGDVVFWGESGWSTSFNASTLFEGEDAAQAALAIGEKEAAANQVVEPYLVEVDGVPGRLAALHYREAIRAKGPTVRPDLVATQA